jgi:hypothetical protein
MVACEAMHKKWINRINAGTFLLTSTTSNLGVLGVMNGVIGDGRERDLSMLLFPLPTYTSNPFHISDQTIFRNTRREHSRIHQFGFGGQITDPLRR